jgi:CHAT domain-containing protein
MFQGMEYFELEKMEDKEVAVLYPIMLPDSVELLVEINQEIEHRRSVVRYEVIKKTALALSNILRTPPPTEDKKKSEREKRERTYKIDSKNLYQWLIGPIEQDLKNKKIKTLVIVPDGILRLVPFAALFDEKGKEFLVQKDYALSISPGLGLLGYSKNVGTSRNYRMLFAGLETPSEEYKKRYSEKKRQIKLEDYARFYFINPGGVEDQIKNEIKKELESLNLKHVKTELEELNNINGLTINKLLFNETFTKENLQREIQKNHYEIVHIASHGDFTSETGHLLTYNDELELSTLRKFLIRDKDTQESIQLLTFSACKTAIGDDRIPLGFTGAALQAEALSALGALWKISDETTARLMKCFYQHLTQHGGKAESLKQAQLELLKDPVNQDPFYWSPFILVGNWL